MSRFAAKDIDSRVFRSVHWADWVEAFGRKRLAAVATGLLAWDAAQHVLAVVDTAQFAKLASWGLFGFAGVTKADVDKALDVVLGGLRAVEGLEEGGLASVGHVSRGYVSADFAHIVEGSVKAKLRAEVESLRRARLVGKTACGAVKQDEFDNLALTQQRLRRWRWASCTASWGRSGRPWPGPAWLRATPTLLKNHRGG